MNETNENKFQISDDKSGQFLIENDKLDEAIEKILKKNLKEDDIKFLIIDENGAIRDDATENLYLTFNRTIQRFFELDNERLKREKESGQIFMLYGKTTSKLKAYKELLDEIKTVNESDKNEVDKNKSISKAIRNSTNIDTNRNFTDKIYYLLYLFPGLGQFLYLMDCIKQKYEDKHHPMTTTSRNNFEVLKENLNILNEKYNSLTSESIHNKQKEEIRNKK